MSEFLYMKLLFQLLIIVFCMSGNVSGQQLIIADSLINQAAEERRNGAFDLALQYDLGALSLAEKNKDQPNMAAAYNGMATDYYRTGNLVKARFYYQKSLEIYSLLGDTINTADQYYKLGMLDTDENKMEDAVVHLNLAKGIFEKKNHYPGLADVYNAFASIFYVQHNIDSVSWYAGRSLEYYKLAGNRDAESFMYINLGALENSRGNHAGALDLVRHGIAVADSCGLINQLRQGYKNLSETYAMMSDWENAYKYQNEYIRYKDTIFNQQKEKALMEVEARYQTAEKERKIQEQKSDLLEKENRIESIRNTRNILILLFIVALITALFFVYRYSTRKKINVLLDEKNKQLEELNSCKDKIFAIVSHDLRSPVSSFSRITSALRMAIDHLSPEEIKKYITDIDTSAAELQGMLRGLLHWSLSQQGGMNVQISSFSLNSVIADALHDCRGSLIEKNISFENSVGEAVIVRADRGLLQIVLRNIISNAVKFSPENSVVQLNAFCSDHHCTIDISDQGAGIAPAVAEKLFGSIGKGEAGGTGFGLFISSELMRKMNGTVELKQTSEKGSTFSVIVPTE
ncbi:Adaptive-response sensory-kinase SasA [bioreactor metagenome]|uniref:histidine kinase n=1 Tax=bioreactor metagenome TaxID=1076179 RepID=A0A644WNI2_9ZZZZ